jgi:hypothetical protein
MCQCRFITYNKYIPLARDVDNVYFMKTFLHLPLNLITILKLSLKLRLHICMYENRVMKSIKNSKNKVVGIKNSNSGSKYDQIHTCMEVSQ